MFIEPQKIAYKIKFSEYRLKILISICSLEFEHIYTKHTHTLQLIEAPTSRFQFQHNVIIIFPMKSPHRKMSNYITFHLDQSGRKGQDWFQTTDIEREQGQIFTQSCQ